MHHELAIPTDRADILDQLRTGCAWTADRVARVHVDELRRPTPCAAFDLGQLLDHLDASMTRFIAALGGVAPPPAGPEHPAERFDRLSRAELAVWTDADLTAAYELPLGTLPAPVVAQVNLAEVVIHGWDVSRATGELADVPAALANQVLDFGHALLTDDNRGPAFGPARPGGTTPSDQMVAFYGRTP